MSSHKHMILQWLYQPHAAMHHIKSFFVLFHLSFSWVSFKFICHNTTSSLLISFILSWCFNRFVQWLVVYFVSIVYDYLFVYSANYGPLQSSNRSTAKLANSQLLYQCKLGMEKSKRKMVWLVSSLVLVDFFVACIFCIDLFPHFWITFKPKREWEKTDNIRVWFKPKRATKESEWKRHSYRVYYTQSIPSIPQQIQPVSLAQPIHT